MMPSPIARGLAAGACLLLAACGSSAGQPSPTPPPGTPVPATPLPATPTPSPTPTASPFPSFPPTSTPAGLADSPWWRIGYRATLEEQVDWSTLSVGTGDGTITGRYPFDPLTGEGLGPPFARGPFAGRVLAALGLPGEPATLSIIDVPTGQEVIVLREHDLLDATLDPSGTVLYWITAGGDEDAVWRLSLADGSRSRLFAFPAETGGIVPAAYVPLRAQVELSADAGRLAALRCQPDACDLAVMELPSGSVSWHAGGELWESLVGFSLGGVQLTGGRCVALPGGTLVDECGAPDLRAAMAQMARNWQADVELPLGWHLEVMGIPQSGMAFEVEAYAVPDDGGDPVPITAVGAFAGNG